MAKIPNLKLIAMAVCEPSILNTYSTVRDLPVKTVSDWERQFNNWIYVKRKRRNNKNKNEDVELQKSTEELGLKGEKLQ